LQDNQDSDVAALEVRLLAGASFIDDCLLEYNHVAADVCSRAMVNQQAAWEMHRLV
jgi:hypothetical protein